MFKRIGEKLRLLFGGENFKDDFLDELEEILIEGDFGALVANEIVERVDGIIKKEKNPDRERIFTALREILEQDLKSIDFNPNPDLLNIYLVFGINGVGKTTTIAKLANYLKNKSGDYRIMLSAADTYRAGAIKQLVEWGKRLNLPVVRQNQGADPGAVIFDSIDSAYSRGINVLIVDTAGRMHNRQDLIRELKKIDKIVLSKSKNSNYEKILVVDATTGQNALNQAEIFHDAIGIDHAILAKYDSTAKGGIVFAITKQLGIPFSFMGVGERLEDLVAFKPDVFLDGLVGKM